MMVEGKRDGGSYRVVGNHPVEGVKPGGIVKIEDRGRARMLVRQGHIAAIAGSKKRARKDKP